MKIIKIEVVTSYTQGDASQARHRLTAYIDPENDDSPFQLSGQFTSTDDFPVGYDKGLGGIARKCFLNEDGPQRTSDVFAGQRLQLDPAKLLTTETIIIKGIK